MKNLDFMSILLFIVHDVCSFILSQFAKSHIPSAASLVSTKLLWLVEYVVLLTLLLVYPEKLLSPAMI